MAILPIVKNTAIRIDDRVATLATNSFIQVRVVFPPGITVPPAMYGVVLIGITGTDGGEQPFIIKAKKLWDLGVFCHRDELFPRGIPTFFDNIKWDCWYKARIVVNQISVLGIRP